MQPRRQGATGRGATCNPQGARFTKGGKAQPEGARDATKGARCKFWGGQELLRGANLHRNNPNPNPEP